ncbi:MAG: hypothetical protein QGF33_10670, partial [Alphaproteobacteria bacterium]|nr:hypothetical protein [Alphaproteobacteria bacterium]
MIEKNTIMSGKSSGQFLNFEKVSERKNAWPTSRAAQFEQQTEIDKAWWTLSHLSDTCRSLFKKSKNK